MLRIDKLNENDVLTVTASQKLTKEDFTAALPEIGQMLDAHGKLRFFIKLEDVSGIEPGALWEDLKFDVKHRRQYGKTAVVGDRKWEEWGAKLSNVLIDAEVKYFSKDKSDDAWRWINA